MKANIKEKWLRKIKIAHIPVVDEEGERKSLRYNEINGALLVPMSDAHLFNTSRSMLYQDIRDQKLIPYHANGQVKTDNSSKRVFFDLYEYLNMNKNEG